MIVAKLSGRLGNQMFQYAVARGVAKRVGAGVVLDTSWIEYEGSKGHPRRYELDCFPLDVRVGHVRQFARLPARTPLLRALQRIRPGRRPFLHAIREVAFGEFLPEVLTTGDDVYLDGYWQSEDYFKQHEGAIRNDFAFPRPLDEAASALAAEIRREQSASVHVRRGDYVSSRFTYALDPGYYRRAVEGIAGRAGEIRVFVFSDDPAWCEANLLLDRPTVVVEHEEGADPLLDMHLMSLCDHHVIANSTFSWWGAWLDPRPEKIVVAPTRWFRDPVLESGEPRTPTEWLRI